MLAGGEAGQLEQAGPERRADAQRNEIPGTKDAAELRGHAGSGA